MSNTQWHFKCQLCGRKDTDLVRIQEHVMDVHGYTREDLQHQGHRMETEVHLYIMPDGKVWLKAWQE